jgi:hypothetical protein
MNLPATEEGLDPFKARLSPCASDRELEANLGSLRPAHRQSGDGLRGATALRAFLREAKRFQVGRLHRRRSKPWIAIHQEARAFRNFR